MRTINVAFVAEELENASGLVSRLDESSNGHEIRLVPKAYNLLTFGVNFASRASDPPTVLVLDSSLTPRVQTVRDLITRSLPYKIPAVAVVNSDEGRYFAERAHRKRNLEGAWDRRTGEIQSLNRLIRDVAFQPIDMGILGLGNLGLGLAENLRDSPSVRKLKLCSPSYETYEDAQAFLSAPFYPNLTFTRRPEEIFDGTQCVAICSSAIKKGGEKLIASARDRSDLLKAEGEMIMNYGRMIGEVGYNGLIVMFTNPVGENANLLYRAARGRITPHQITFPFNIDAMRFLRLTRARFRECNDPNLLIAENELRKLFATGLVGTHGLPQVALSRADVRKESKLKKYAALAAALTDLSEIVEGVMRASARLRVGYRDAQRESVGMFDDIAHFRPRPQANAYSYLQLDPEWGGYIAVPTMFRYNGRLEVLPDIKAINRFDPDFTTQYLHDQLRKQILNVDEFINNREQGTIEHA